MTNRDKVLQLSVDEGERDSTDSAKITTYRELQITYTYTTDNT